MFDYEQVLVRRTASTRCAIAAYVQAEQLADEVLITYPVEIDRLDIYNQFLMPAGISPKRHKAIETTDIMLQMVASGRGVAALPRWLVEEYADKMDIVPVRLGRQGIAKQIFLGIRDSRRRYRLPARFRRTGARAPQSAKVNDMDDKPDFKRNPLPLPNGHDKVLLHSCCAPCSAAK